MVRTDRGSPLAAPDRGRAAVLSPVRRSCHAVTRPTVGEKSDPFANEPRRLIFLIQIYEVLQRPDSRANCRASASRPALVTPLFFSRVLDFSQSIELPVQRIQEHVPRRIFPADRLPNGIGCDRGKAEASDRLSGKAGRPGAPNPFQRLDNSGNELAGGVHEEFEQNRRCRPRAGVPGCPATGPLPGSFPDSRSGTVSVGSPAREPRAASRRYAPACMPGSPRQIGRSIQTREVCRAA